MDSERKMVTPMLQKMSILQSIMKGLLAVSLVMSANALACETGLICPGATVYPDDYSAGFAQVIAINPSTGQITVKGNYSSSYGRYSVEQLAIPTGCMQGMCVGDRVIPSNYSAGYASIIAINTYKKTFTVKGNYSDNYSRYSAQSLATLSGCYRGVCVGENVIPSDYSNGYATVIAFNPVSRVFTVKGNYSSTYGYYERGKLAREKGCVSGICVGDQVFPDDYTAGYATVVAVSRENRTITLRGNYSSSYGRYSPERLAILKACEDYDADARRE
jgi:hypothetical protein